jgi:peptidyl-dipeptidase Dcp
VASTPQLQDLKQKLQPVISAHAVKLYQNPALFAKVKEVYDARDTLDPVQRRLTEKYYISMVDSGAALSSADKKKFISVSKRLAARTATFNKKLLDGAKAHAVILNADELGGIPEDDRKAYAQAAAKLGKEGSYAVMLGASNVLNFLQYSSNREARQRVWEAKETYTNRGDAFDTNRDIKAIIKLRQEMAQLLGYPTFADYSTSRKMAQTPAAALTLLTSLVGPSKEAYESEIAAVEEFARQEDGFTDRLQPWDWAHYARRHEEKVIGITDKELEPYLEVGTVRAAFFKVCQRVFDLTFEPRPDLPVPHKEAQAWEVKRLDGGHVGLFITDDLARAGEKRDGAWMNELRGQDGLTGDTPIIFNTMNYRRPAEGKPTLLKLKEATTLFHEGGHGLHGLLSESPVPSLAGTRVLWDVVELPSQFMESMLTHPKLMAENLRHYETGQPMPDEMISKVQRKLSHNSGHFVLRQLSFGICDLELYGRADANFNPQTFEQETLDRHGFPENFRARPMLQQFSHIMGGYAAGYYSYMWADVLVADAEEAFRPDPLNRELGQKMAKEIYASGNTRDPVESYRAFRGRDADPLALRRRFGWE